MENEDGIFIGQNAMTDEQFSDVGEKYALLEPILEISLSPSERRRLRQEAMTRLGISERTLRTWLSAIKRHGMAGLVRKVRSDRGKERKFVSALLEKIVVLLRENPYRTIPGVMKLLAADPHSVDAINAISASSVYRRLKEARIDLSALRVSTDQKTYRHFEAAYINQLWQGDARHGIPIPDPANPTKSKMTYLFAWIDDYSRKILFAKYYWDEKLPRLEDAFRQAVLRWGLPEKIYLDNGSAYVSKQFAFIVSGLGVRKIHHPPYQSWCKGKVEAIMKLIKGFQREAAMAGFKTIEELNSALEAWLDIEYDRKIHSTTGQTPHERFIQSAERFPPKRITDLEKFIHLFFWQTERTVTKFGFISLKSNTYRIRGVAPGEIVSVRFDPFDLSEIFVYHRQRFLAAVKAHLLTNRQTPEIPEERKTPAPIVSEHARTYFTALRERHLSHKKIDADRRINFTKLAPKEKQS